MGISCDDFCGTISLYIKYNSRKEEEMKKTKMIRECTRKVGRHYEFIR